MSVLVVLMGAAVASCIPIPRQKVKKVEIFILNVGRCGLCVAVKLG